MRFLVLLVLLTACAAESAPPPSQPAKVRHTWDDDEIRKIDFPEATTPPPPPPSKPTPREAPRATVKVELAVFDVISWDDVKVRGGMRGSVVRGVVSLTGWLATAKGTSRVEVVTVAGREVTLDVPESARELVGGYSGLRVAVLETDEKGEVDVAVTPLTAGDDAKVALATRVHVAPGEALVVGGHRSEEGDKRKDQLVLVTLARTTSR